MAHYSIAESPAASNIILYFQDIAYLIQALSYPSRHDKGNKNDIPGCWKRALHKKITKRVAQNNFALQLSKCQQKDDNKLYSAVH